MNLNHQNDYPVLCAVDINDVNAGDKKNYETKTVDNKTYFVIDKNKKLDLPRIADYLKRFFENSKKNFNVDLNSFLEFSKSEHDKFHILL